MGRDKLYCLFRAYLRKPLEQSTSSSGSIAAQFHEVAIGVSDVQAAHESPASVALDDVS